MRPRWKAALITRREETAAMRSQANTARLIEQNPTLMRLREIEALEKVAEKGRLSVVVGEGGLAGRVVKLVKPYPGGARAPPGPSVQGVLRATWTSWSRRS